MIERTLNSEDQGTAVRVLYAAKLDGHREISTQYVQRKFKLGYVRTVDILLYLVDKGCLRAKPNGGYEIGNHRNVKLLLNPDYIASVTTSETGYTKVKMHDDMVHTVDENASLVGVDIAACYRERNAAGILE